MSIPEVTSPEEKKRHTCSRNLFSRLGCDKSSGREAELRTVEVIRRLHSPDQKHSLVGIFGPFSPSSQTFSGYVRLGRRSESTRLSVSAEADAFIERAGLMEKGEPATADVQSITKAKREIATLLQGYRNALIESDVEAVMKLYASDSVLMAEKFPSVVGWDDIKTWFAKCFKWIALDVAFNVKEVVVTSYEYAFAGTTSSGTQKDLDTVAVSKDRNHELFMIRKANGNWKLTRYCFSNTIPVE